MEIKTPPKELCLLLDHQARADLRQANERGFINRSHRKKRGVQLLLDLHLIERTKTLKFMYRHEPTDLGREVANFLPSRKAEWAHIMGHEPLVYADGTIVDYDNVPRYANKQHYESVLDRVYRDNGLYGQAD